MYSFRQRSLAMDVPSLGAWPRNLSGKLALVTGGDSGLGFSIALAMAKRGAEAGGEIFIRRWGWGWLGDQPVDA